MSRYVLTYTLQPLPVTWPGGARTPPDQQQKPQFKTTYNGMHDLLAYELWHLGAKNVVVAIDVPPHEIRADGQLRANARPVRSSGVVLSFDSKHGRLTFPCDTYREWMQNLDAIARVLEDRRRAERYGVRPGKPYADFKAIAATSSATLTTDQAATLLFTIAPAYLPAQILASRDVAKSAVRAARARAHPDAGGSAEQFARVGAAEAVLKAHHGGTL